MIGLGLCDNPIEHGCGRLDAAMASAAIIRYNEILDRIMRVLSKSATDGCDIRRSGLFKIYVHPRVAYDLSLGVRALEARDGRSYASAFSIISLPSIGLVCGFDIAVDGQLPEDGIVLRYEVRA